MPALIAAALLALAQSEPAWPGADDPGLAATSVAVPAAPTLDEPAAAAPRDLAAPAGDLLERLRGEEGPGPRGTSALPGDELFSLRRMILPALLLLLLGCLALFLSGRRSRRGSHLKVIESVPLGPKRSLVLAEALGEQLILGCSEAGIRLLASRPSPQPELEAKEVGADASGFDRYAAFAAEHADAPASTFDDLLEESAEDLELRRRLAEGLRGRVP